MATPLSATGRISIPYTVAGKLHYQRVFVRGITPVGATYNINSRTLDANDIDWQDAAEALVTAAATYLGGTSVIMGEAILEQFSDPVWEPLQYHDVSGISLHAGTYEPAHQVTLVLRDKAFKKVKVVLAEDLVTQLFHFTSEGAAQNLVPDWVKEFTQNNTLTTAPYIWMVGRSDQYLADNPLVGCTGTYNRKFRRARGLT